VIWAACFFFALGLFFAVFGNIGMLVFPDIYTRLNASSKCSTTAVVSIFIGCILVAGINRMSSRILVIALFYLITSPVSAHIIGRRAWGRGVLPWRRRKP
jgi:multicomponent Na+:H+ antiporter subunit G